MHRALIITLLALTSLAPIFGCSGEARTDAAPQAAVADADKVPLAKAVAPEDSTAADASTDAREGSDAAGETVPNPEATDAAEGEWAHADTPAEVPESVTAEEGRAPDFKVTTLDGKLIDSSVLYGTKPVSITIWATWCPPCLAEIPTIQKLYNEHGDDVQFIAISVDDPKQLKEVEKMVAARKMTYPVGLDVKREIGLAFEATGIPLTVFVDPSGAEIGREEGWGGEENLIHAFEEAFGKSGDAPAKRKGSSV